MFTKLSVTQALIDVTKSIMEDDEKKKMLLEPGIDETGFHKAAHAARKSGQSHFEFQGKKYPVTSKPNSEGMEPPEKIGGQVLKKHDDKAAAKGHSSTVRPVEEDEKKKDSPFNWKDKPSQIPKKPGELTGHDSKKTSTGMVYTKKYKKDDMKEEAHPDEKEDKALVKKMVKPSALKREEEKETHLSKHSMTNEKYVTPPEARKIADQEVHKHEKHMHKDKKETKLGEEEERHMTGGEKEKREKIVMSMKKGMKGFKERYGKRAKNVIYATATKQAMKEEVEDIFEEVEYKKSHGIHGHPDTIQVLHAYHKGKKMGHIEEYHHMDASGKHTGKTRWAAHHYHTGDETVGHRTAEEANDCLMGCHDKHCKTMKEMGYHTEEYYAEDIGGISTISEKKKKEIKEDEHIRVDGETDMKTKTVDTLSGRVKVPAEYHNKAKPYKVALTVGEGVDTTDYNPKSQGGTRKELLAKYSKSGDPKHAEAARKAGATQSELKSARGLDNMFGHRAGVDKLGIKKEEYEEIDEASGNNEKRHLDSIIKMREVKKSKHDMAPSIHDKMYDALENGNHKKIDQLHKVFKHMSEEVEEIDEGMMDTMKKVGGKVLKKLGHGSDEDMRKDLQRKMGVPQTGKKSTKEEFEHADEAFKGPEAGSGTGDHPFVTNENSPMNLAKELAKKSFKKIKQETMMGKIAGGI
jgi:hypothetical protein